MGSEMCIRDSKIGCAFLKFSETDESISLPNNKFSLGLENEEDASKEVPPRKPNCLSIVRRLRKTDSSVISLSLQLSFITLIATYSSFIQTYCDRNLPSDYVKRLYV